MKAARQRAAHSDLVVMQHEMCDVTHVGVACFDIESEPGPARRMRNDDRAFVAGVRDTPDRPFRPERLVIRPSRQRRCPVAESAQRPPRQDATGGEFGATRGDRGCDGVPFDVVEPVRIIGNRVRGKNGIRRA